MYTAKENYYLENGRATTDSKNGKNPPLLIVGAVVSDKEAEKLGLPKKDAARNKEAVEAAIESTTPAAVAKHAAHK